MSGRGARGRNDIQKNIEKQEKKKEAKDATEKTPKPTTETGWNLSFRGHAPSSSIIPGRRASLTATISSRSSGQSKASDKGHAGSMSPGLDESEEKKYQFKGKETKHPRGRGGGVPARTKTGDSAYSAHTSYSNASYESGPASANNAPPTLSAEEKSWASMKLWYGNGQPTQRWKGFETDAEMFMSTGDCLVFFSEDSSGNSEPSPVLRVHTEKLQEARSSFLTNLIMYGEIEQDDYSPPPSVVGSPPTHSLTSSNLGSLDEESVPPSKDSVNNTLPSPQRNIPSRSARSSESQYGSRLFRDLKFGAFPTRAQSDGASSGDFNIQEVDVTHEIWFPAPSYIQTLYEQRRHHLAIRNFLALLYDKPIVGSDLFEMLTELQMVMDIMYELNDPNRRPSTAAMIVEYVLGRRLDDVRGSLSSALGLLAWSEKKDVSWDHGYMEAFIHAVGMLTKSSFDRHEFKRLSPVTRHNLEKSFSGMQIKILEAEGKLSAFVFSDLWNLSNAGTDNAAFKSCESLREYLCCYYAHIYGSWPPRTGKDGQWLTREAVGRLQRDFGALYDVLVNRDIDWDICEERHTRKWQMTSKTTITDVFSPDLFGLPITDMLIGFDNQHGYQHIPHPYPLLPRRVPSLTPASPKKKHLFSMSKKDKNLSSHDPSEQMKVSLAFGDATNISKLGMDLEPNDLRDQFLEYEKTIATELRDVPTAHARLGRWILLYGTLQVLSTLSVDTFGVKHFIGVHYFLCPSLDNCPPWPSQIRLGMGPVKEASQLSSHCWTAPFAWEYAHQSLRRGVGVGAGAHGFTSYELEESADRVSELDGRSLDPRSRGRDRKVCLQHQQQQLHAEYEHERRRRERAAALSPDALDRDRKDGKDGKNGDRKDTKERDRLVLFPDCSRDSRGRTPPSARPDLPPRSPLRRKGDGADGVLVLEPETEREGRRRLVEYFAEGEEDHGGGVGVVGKVGDEGEE
ncbi:uncharacterized protein K452DRAFT_43333 [Aplosporella prunicola CBS 121167]|uniref:DUF8004 domain-containing protein n=1 Tax=Aplosporella prunicola CBS 121167 TaxID=1176127 RepID=A0A6A6BES0_9PEZI|nr:uncharacterized protein K452DRAFT_43333 [Aplosporella prunicola CBS 121167]KAF2140971.1 hypothetical protein K452DRAFT_43333 [Aplosporella prunicola CBS 121167]